MIYQTKNNERIALVRYEPRYSDALVSYYKDLDAESKKNFQPHPFDLQSIQEILHQNQDHIAYLGIKLSSQKIISYHLIKCGYVAHDMPRLMEYQHQFNAGELCTYAPSVAPNFQGQGIAQAIFHFMVNELKALGFKKIVLWGGVKKNNSKALHFYKKLGFGILGNFDYQGSNLDMLYLI